MKKLKLKIFLFALIVQFTFTGCSTYRNLDKALANPLDVKTWGKNI